MNLDHFYMVYLEGERTPAYKHETIDGAVREAKRLAETHEKRAYVLGTIKYIELSKFKEVDVKVTKFELPF